MIAMKSRNSVSLSVVMQHYEILLRDATVWSIKKEAIVEDYTNRTISFAQVQFFLEEEKSFYFSAKTFFDELNQCEDIPTHRVQTLVANVHDVLSAILQSLVAQSQERSFLQYYKTQVFQDSVLVDIAKIFTESLSKIPAYIPVRDEMRVIIKKRKFRGFSLIAAICLAFLATFSTPRLVEASPVAKPLISFSAHSHEDLFVKASAAAYIKDGEDFVKIGTFPKQMIVQATKISTNWYSVVANVSGKHQEVYVEASNVFSPKQVLTEIATKLSVSDFATFTKEWEGFVSKAYTDSRGFVTIGFGTCIDLRIRKDAPQLVQSVGLNYEQVLAKQQSLDRQRAQLLLEKDIEKCILFAKSIFSEFESYPADVQKIIVDMVYNLGQGGLLKFKNTIRAIKERNYDLAAHELQNSLWYSQVGQRSRHHVLAMQRVAQTAQSYSRAA